MTVIYTELSFQVIICGIIKEYTPKQRNTPITIMPDFQLLLSENTKENNYVNATRLCKAFDKRLDVYLKTDKTQKLGEAIATKYNTTKKGYLKTKRGKGGGTFIHPLLAIDLAEWLSPEFGLFVKETFKAFIDADITLAEDIVNRTNDIEGLERLTIKSKARTKQLKTYHGLHDELKENGCEGLHHAVVNKYNNNLVGIETRKNGITQEENYELNIIESMELLKLQKRKGTINGAWHAVNITKKTGEETKEFISQQLSY